MSLMENEFACPSGCMGPETCVNTPLIKGLVDVSSDLSRASTPTAAQLERIIAGDISHLEARRETINATKQALIGSCAVFRLVQQQYGKQ